MFSLPFILAVCELYYYCHYIISIIIIIISSSRSIQYYNIFCLSFDFPTLMTTKFSDLVFLGDLFQMDARRQLVLIKSHLVSRSFATGSTLSFWTL